MKEQLTKRELITAMAMQAMLYNYTHTFDIIPELAVEMADKIIAELNKVNILNAVDEICCPNCQSNNIIIDDIYKECRICSTVW